MMTGLDIAVLAVTPDQDVDVTAMMDDAPAPADDPTPAEGSAPAARVRDFDVIGLEEFQAHWRVMHFMLGSYAGSRIGAPCDLASQADGPTGTPACVAAYELLNGNDYTARAFLNAKGGTFKQLGAVALHGFMCVQVVRAARASAELPPPASAA